jgi:hypothetical protein
MMQARAAAVGEGDVVNAALTVCPGGPEPAGLIVGGIFRHPETDLIIEGNALVDIRRKAVEMVDSERLYALIERVFLMDRRKPVHFRIEFERNAMRIAGPECARLVGPFDPFDRQALALEEMFRLVEVFVGKHLEAQVPCFSDTGLLQDDAVMAALFERA